MIGAYELFYSQASRPGLQSGLSWTAGQSDLPSPARQLKRACEGGLLAGGAVALPPGWFRTLMRETQIHKFLAIPPVPCRRLMPCGPRVRPCSCWRPP